MAECLASIAGIIEPFISLLHLDRRDDDIFDKINHKLSTLVYFLLMLMVLLYQIILERAIRCWTPAEFPDHWTDYTNQLCWVKNKYYVPHDVQNIPGPQEVRTHIVYYQWVPYMLFGLGVMTYLPGLIWYSGSKSLGMDINYMVRNLREMDIAVNPDLRDRMGKCISKHIVRAIAINRDSKRGKVSSCVRSLATRNLWCGPRSGNFLLFVWLLTKTMYLLSSALQFYVSYRFIGPDFLRLGPAALDYVFGSGPEIETFPKDILCDFESRTFAANMPHTVQCALPINIIHEKVYIFVWFYIVFTGIVNLYGLLRGLIIHVDTRRSGKVKELLKMSESYEREDRRVLQRFSNDFLRSDGVITLVLLEKNCNPVVVTEIVKTLWDMYNYDPKFPLPSTRDGPRARA